MFIVSLINGEESCILAAHCILDDKHCSLSNLYINQVRGDDSDYYEAGVVKSFVQPRVYYVKMN